MNYFCLKLFQPSNSLRAAELLESNGAAGAVGGFGLNVPLAGVDSAVKLTGEDSVDCSDADFSLVIKRMAKKDSTTKLKVGVTQITAAAEW